MSRMTLRCGTSRVELSRTTTFGRGEQVALLVNGAGVQPHHGAFIRTRGRWQVAGRAALRCNGRQVDGCALQVGDLVAVGSVVLQVEEIRRRRAWPAAVACLLVASLLGLLSAGFARAALPPGAGTALHLEPGQTLRWSGDAAEVELLLPLYDPARSLVELEVRTPGREGALALHVNGVAAAQLTQGIRLQLDEHLVAGTNRLLVGSALSGRLQVLEARAIVTPLPDCSASACLQGAQAALEHGRRWARERQVAPGNLFEAWRWLHRARAFHLAAGSGRELEEELEPLRAEVEQALAERCGLLRFAAARHLALGERAAAHATARELAASFPGEEHACHRSAGELLRLLERDGGLP